MVNENIQTLTFPKGLFYCLIHTLNNLTVLKLFILAIYTEQKETLHNFI